MSAVKIIECPRDAMQGIEQFIPTDVKAAYIQQLLKVGFHSIDMGSFVSEKVIPQMRDTQDVINKLDLSSTISRLLVIVANAKGAEMAESFEEINYLGFPFSISRTFQERNTNATIEEALERVDEIQNICIRSGKELIIYISMAFGNPYGEVWNVDIASHWVEVMVNRGIKTISLADTIGTSTVESIEYLVGKMISAYPQIEFGTHLHCRPDDWRDKIDAAYNQGCRRFDGAIMGFGGCPMASDHLVGNMSTENLKLFFEEAKADTGLDDENFTAARELAMDVFPK